MSSLAPQTTYKLSSWEKNFEDKNVTKLSFHVDLKAMLVLRIERSCLTSLICWALILALTKSGSSECKVYLCMSSFFPDLYNLCSAKARTGCHCHSQHTSTMSAWARQKFLKVEWELSPHLTALLIARLSVDDIRRVSHWGEPQAVRQLTILLLHKGRPHTQTVTHSSWKNTQHFTWVQNSDTTTQVLYIHKYILKASTV